MSECGGICELIGNGGVCRFVPTRRNIKSWKLEKEIKKSLLKADVWVCDCMHELGVSGLLNGVLPQHLETDVSLCMARPDGYKYTPSFFVPIFLTPSLLCCCCDSRDFRVSV